MDNNITVKNIKDIPVTIFLAVSIIVVFSLYTTAAIKSIPCGENVVSKFYSNFIHADIYHLLSNLWSLYAISRIEQMMGAKKFVLLVIFLLVLNTILEVSIHTLYPTLKCSIGISGLLFGLATWEIVTQKKFDGYLISSIMFMVILPSVTKRNASLLGHAVGAISGVAGGLLWKKISPYIK